jgi:hypothetical protein
MTVMDSPHDRVPAGLQPSILSFPPSTLRCCCGRPDCAYLQRSYAALEGLEKDLATAARLGKVKSLLISQPSTYTTLGPKKYIVPFFPLLSHFEGSRLSTLHLDPPPIAVKSWLSKQAGNVADSSSAGLASSS